MRKYMRILACFLLFTMLAIPLCSCTKVIDNCADELVSSRWSATLDNGNTITLYFAGDGAVLMVRFSDDTSVSIYGLCEISDISFVIHDIKSMSAFAFNYIVHFDRVEVIYNQNTVVLYKCE